MGAKVPWNESSWTFHSPGVNVPQNESSLYGLFAPGNESAEERKVQIPVLSCFCQAVCLPLCQKSFFCPVCPVMF